MSKLRTRPRDLLLGIVVGSTLILSACGGVATVEAEIEGAKWALFVQSGQRGSAETAGIEGSLHFDSSTGCIYLRSGEVLTTVAWPEGTDLAENQLGVQLADGSIIAAGDPVLGTGASQVNADLLDTCPGSGLQGDRVFFMDLAKAGP